MSSGKIKMLQMLKHGLFLVLYLSVSIESAQANTDSLLGIYNNPKNTIENRLKALSSFYLGITRYYPDSALNFADEGRKLALENDLLEPYLDLTLRKANTLNVQKQEYENARLLYNELARKGGTFPMVIGRAYLGLSVLDLEKQNYTASRVMLKKAIDEFTKVRGANKGKWTGIAYTNLARVFEYEGDYQKAMEISRSSYFALRREYPKEASAAARNTGSYHTNLGNYDSALWYMRVMPQDTLDMYGMSWFNHNQAVVFEEMGRNDSAVYFYSQSISYADKAQNYIQKGIAFHAIAGIYMEDKNFKEARTYLDKAVAIFINEDNNRLLGASYGYLGELFLDMGVSDSAYLYYAKSLSIANNLENPSRKGYAFKGLGNFNLRIGNIFKAVSLFDSSAYYFNQSGEQEKQQEAMLEKGRCFVVEKDGIRALEVLIPLISILEKDRPHKLVLNGYMLISEAYSLVQQHDSAAYFLQRAISTKDSITLKSNKKIENEVLAKFGVKLAKQDKYLAELKTAKERTKFYYALGVLALSILFLTLIVIRHRKYKQEKEKTTELKVEAAQKHVQHTKEILQNQSGLILEKNRIIGELRETLQMHFGEDNSEIEKFDHLLEQKILTKADWEKFKSAFKLLHSGFIASMNKKYEDLTEAEIRMLCMIKLDLSLDEMADMLGILPRSMERTVNRFNNKYGIDPNSLAGII